MLFFQHYPQMMEECKTGTYATFRRNRLKKEQWKNLKAENKQLKEDKDRMQELIDRLAAELQRQRQTVCVCGATKNI